MMGMSRDPVSRIPRWFHPSRYERMRWFGRNVIKVYQLQCDRCGARRRPLFLQGPPEEAVPVLRFEGSLEGWTSIGDADLCPDCSARHFWIGPSVTDTTPSS